MQDVLKGVGHVKELISNQTKFGCMSDDWLAKVDEALKDHEKDKGDGSAREESVKEAVRLFFSVYLACRLEIDRELKMIPWQWEMVEYIGTRHWELRRFPFSRLQSVTISEGNASPNIEARFGADEDDGVELYVNFIEESSVDHDFLRNCLIYKGSYESSLNELKDALHVAVGKWIDSMILDDPRLFVDWAITADLDKRTP